MVRDLCIRKMFFTVVALSLTLYFGCFKLQNYDPDEPEWPRYDVGGIVLDSITKEPVNGCVVTIERWQLYFEQDDFISALDTTDSGGNFLVDSVAPGCHYIYFEKEGYCPDMDSLDVFVIDSLNCCWRHTLVSLVDVPHIAISDSIFDVGVKMGNTNDCTLTISNKGITLSLNWTLTGDGGWIIVNPQSGSVPPQGSQDINFHFDTSVLIEDGIYRKWLHISSNDCIEPIKEIFVRLVATIPL